MFEIESAWDIKGSVDRTLGDLVETSRRKVGFAGRLGTILFRKMLTDGFAFAVRVSGQVNRVGFLCRLLYSATIFLLLRFLCRE